MVKSYNIWSPPFESLSGGIRVLYGLRSWLETRGQMVEINGPTRANQVTIYPEIVNDNPLKSNNIVRYILQKPGLMTTHGTPGPTTFPGEKVFVFSELYNTVGVDQDHIMFLPVLNLHLFKDQKKPRKGGCIYIRRHPRTIITDYPVLTEGMITDQQGLADYLNTIEIMHFYGPTSAMHDIARLCGCRVIIHPAEDKFKQTKEEFSKYELYQDFNGISWEKDNEKKIDTERFTGLYFDLRKRMWDKIDNFINLTQ